MTEPMPFFTRLWFSYVCFFAVLFDGVFAARVQALREGEPALPSADTEPPSPEEGAESSPSPTEAGPTNKNAAKSRSQSRKTNEDSAQPEAHDTTAALQLLALLQREGRLVDFLQQNVDDFPDVDVAAAARVVHAGCRKAIRAHSTIEPVRDEDEGAQVTLEAGYDPHSVKLTGQVAGDPPYRGTLKHRGWRAKALELPRLVGDNDASVLAPAEVEL